MNLNGRDININVIKYYSIYDIFVYIDIKF